MRNWEGCKRFERESMTGTGKHIFNCSVDTAKNKKSCKLFEIWENKQSHSTGHHTIHGYFYVLLNPEIKNSLRGSFRVYYRFSRDRYL